MLDALFCGDSGLSDHRRELEDLWNKVRKHWVLDAETKARREHADISQAEDQDAPGNHTVGGCQHVPADDLSLPQLEVIPHGAGQHLTIQSASLLGPARVMERDGQGNDIHRIQQLLPLVRQSAEEFGAQLRRNDNAFAELACEVARYRKAISGTIPQIPWALVWGLGVRLEQAAAAVSRNTIEHLAPALDDAALAAFQLLRTLHGSLILATVEGRELQEQANYLRMIQAKQKKVRNDIVAVSDNPQWDRPTEQDASADAARTVGSVRHSDPDAACEFATMKHMFILLISAATIAAPAQHIGGIVGVGATMATWEAVKASPIFKAAAAALGKQLGQLLESGGTRAQNHLARLITVRVRADSRGNPSA